MLVDDVQTQSSDRAFLTREVGKKLRHPPSFYCPISQLCMHDPVVLADGHTYERRQIERWLSKHSTSPVSGLQLPRQDMVPNHALRNAIEEYFQEIQSVHRRAILKTIHEPHTQRLESHVPFLRTIEALMQCSLLMNADLSTECALRHIMEEARTLVGAEAASIFFVDEARQELYSLLNSSGCELRIPLDAGIAGHVATTGESVIVHDAYGDNRFTTIVDAKTGFRTCDMMCVPLKVKKGDIFGVVQLINKMGTATELGCELSSFAERADGNDPLKASFLEEDLQFLQVFASQAAMTVFSGGFTLPQDPESSNQREVSLSDMSEDRAAAKKPKGDVQDNSNVAPNGTAPTVPATTTIALGDCKLLPQPGGVKKSGRARQRAAKFWAKTRQRTPSPTSTRSLVTMGSHPGAARLGLFSSNSF